MVTKKLSLVSYTFAVSCAAVLISLGPISEASMRESPQEVQKRRLKKYGNKRVRKLLSVDHIEQLSRDGIIVIDNVLNSRDLGNAREDVKLLRDSGSFEKSEQDGADVRTDLVHWISESISEDRDDHSHDGLSFALSLIRSIPSELMNDDKYSRRYSLNMGVPFSNQLTSYSSTGFHYAPHRDKGNEVGYLLQTLQYFTQPGIQEREYTIILYLNEEKWIDGRTEGASSTEGCLRCFMGSEASDDTGVTATQVLNIDPDGGRLVIFDAKTVLHEVVHTKRERIALTCWVGGSHSNYMFLRPYCIPWKRE